MDQNPTLRITNVNATSSSGWGCVLSYSDHFCFMLNEGINKKGVKIEHVFYLVRHTYEHRSGARITTIVPGMVDLNE